jgi:AraC family carnitine catabolism transcriptional activator
MPQPEDAPETQVGFLLTPGFSSLAFFCALEPLRVANRMAERNLYTWRIFSADGGPVEASNGLRMVADARLEQARAPEVLIVCAGFEPAAGASPAVLAALRRAAAQGSAVGALDTGAVLLALAGLVGRETITLHWEAVPAFREAFPDIVVSGELFEDRGAIFTCAGGTAALDMMLHRIARRHGDALAHAVSEQFIHDRIRSRGDAQRMSLGRRLQIDNAKVLQTVELMERTLEAPLNTGVLARRAGVTQRQLERLFRTHLGDGPGEFYRNLRLARGRDLLRQSDLDVLEIAVGVGFASRAAFSRAYAKRYGRAPRADRREALAGPGAGATAG